MAKPTLFVSKQKKGVEKQTLVLTKDQLEALKRLELFLEDSEDILVLEGFAGTGKTAILQEYIQFLDSEDYSFCLCAPTHKAKFVMEDVTGYEAITVHKLLKLSPNIEIYNLNFKELEFLSNGLIDIVPKSIIIIDEASMINDTIYDFLVKTCKDFNAKILFIGDSAQLAAVGDKNLSKVFTNKNKIQLTHIHRQSEGSGLAPLLLKLRNKPRSKFETIEAENGSLYVYNNPKSFIKDIIPLYKNGVNNQNVNGVKLIAFTNKRVREFNKCIRKFLWNDNEQYHQFEVLTAYTNFEANGTKLFNSIDYVVLEKPVKRDKFIPHFMNLSGYDLCLYDTIYNKIINVFVLSKDINKDYLDSLAQLIETTRLSAIDAKKSYNRTLSSILWKKYFQIMNSFATPGNLMFDNRVIKPKDLDYGYSMTVHKVQGSSLSNICIDMKNVLTCRDAEAIRQLQYVALSRTKNNAYILT